MKTEKRLVWVCDVCGAIMRKGFEGDGWWCPEGCAGDAGMRRQEREVPAPADSYVYCERCTEFVVVPAGAPHECPKCRLPLSIYPHPID